MEIETFRKGLIVGFAVAMPVGPIGVLVASRSLRAMLSGISAGLGAAVADALYAAMGALATALVARVLARGWLLDLAGGLALAGLALRTWRSRPVPSSSVTAAAPELLRAFAETLVLTLANPATIVSWAAVSAGLGLATKPSAGAAIALAAGAFVGSALWWLVLSGAVRAAARRLSSRSALADATRGASAIVLAAFAALALLDAFRRARR